MPEYRSSLSLLLELLLLDDPDDELESDELELPWLESELEPELLDELNPE